MYKSAIILILLFIGCKATEKSQLLSTDKVLYSFDYKLQANSTYLVKSLNENRTSSEIIGDPGEAISNQIESLLEGENHATFGEHIRVMTGHLKDGKLTLSIHCDSVISKYDSPIMEEAMAMNPNLIQETIDASLRTTTFAHSIDLKNIKLDSTDYKSIISNAQTKRNKYFPRGLNKISAKNRAFAWAAQKKYPYGSMAIGDTFTHAELPYIYKPSKRDSMPKMGRKLSVEGQKRKDELKKMRDGLKSAKTEDKSHYILESVEAGIAYFKVIHQSSNTIMGLLKSKGEGAGLLEYDLKEHFYRKFQTESSQEIRTNIEEAVSVTKGDYRKTILIEMVK